MLFRGTVLVLCLLWCSTGWSQRFDILVSGNYSVPQFDSYFRGGYESRLGYTLRFRDIRQERFAYGALLEQTRFTPRVDNPVGITNARLFTFVLQLSYNLLSESPDRFEPVGEFGFNYISYNGGSFFGQGIGANIGGQYSHQIDPGYGLEFAMLLKTVFDKFGRDQNPLDSTFQQMIQIRLGLWFAIR